MGDRLWPASLYPRARGGVLIPLALFCLPESVELAGDTWALKDEFHVTAAHTPWLAERAGLGIDEAWRALAAALEGRRIGAIDIRDELRIVRDGDERTLVVMVTVDGLDELYADLSERLGTPLSPPPAHITLYTRPGGEGIGLHDDSDLRALTEPVPDVDAMRVLRRVRSP